MKLIKKIKERNTLRKFRKNLKQYDAITVKMYNGIYRLGTFHHYNRSILTVYVGGYGIIEVERKDVFPNNYKF